MQDRFGIGFRIDLASEDLDPIHRFLHLEDLLRQLLRSRGALNTLRAVDISACPHRKFD